MVALCSVAASNAAAPHFEVYEKSILELQQAQVARRVTARGLVEAYIARIEAYDRAGPKLNAIVTLNSRALEEADALDLERAKKGSRGPLHGIPLLVKDNYDAVGMPTAGGSVALAGLMPSRDAYQVQQLRAAGAIILGKTTMHELAGGITTRSSLTGATRNPYDPARMPGGSSGGTGAAVAASLAAAGMGTDTSGSIQIPASFQNLVGLRTTRGLASRTGVMPLSSSQDVAGPMARSVADLAILLDATVGLDPEDPASVDARRWIPKSYRDSLRPGGLKGARIGVERSLFGNAEQDQEVGDIVLAALETMKSQGAQLIAVDVPILSPHLEESETTEYEFKFDLASYLGQHPGAPVATLGEILDRGLYSAEMERRLRSWNQPQSLDTPKYRQTLALRASLRAAVLEAFRAQRLDALAYPGVLRKPALLGASQGGWGPGCQLSAATGLPQIAIPAGFSAEGLPVGMALLGGDFSEPLLLKLAYGWELAARLRRAPWSTPALSRAARP